MLSIFSCGSWPSMCLLWTDVYLGLPSILWLSGLFSLILSSISSVQSLSCVQHSATPWTAAHQASLSITNSWSPPKPRSIVSVIPSKYFNLCHPFSSCTQSLPASESFPMSELFTWGGQSIGVSALASFLPKNTQDQSPLEWSGCIFSSQSNSHILTWPQEKP